MWYLQASDDSYVDTVEKKRVILIYLIIMHRQFISEFGPATLPVYLLKTSGESQLLTLSDLLPYSFALEQGQKYILK